MNPSVLSQIQPQQSTQPAQPDAVFDVPGESNGVPTHSGNWFTHLLPTLGSVAAPIIGGLLAPETGGLSLLAGAGLSGAGAAAGKAAENGAEGKQLFNGGDLTAGAEGLAGGLAGGVAGKVIGKGASILGNTAENIATKQAADTAAQDSIDTAANTYKDVSPQLQKAYNAKDSLAHVTNMGYDVADPTNLTHVANTSNDVLNDVLDKSLANSGPVDMSNYPQLIKDAIAKESGTLGSYDPTALAKGRLGTPNNPAGKLLSQLEDLGAGIAKTNGDPNELRGLTTKLGQLAQDAKPTVTQATGAIDPQQRAIYNVINDVRDKVKTALYDRPEVNDALAGQEGNLTAKDVGTQELADHLNGVISGAGSGDKTAAQDLLNEISRNINIGNLGQEGSKVGQIVTSTGAKARAAAESGLGEAGASGNPILEMGNNFVGGPHTGILSAAVKGATHAAQNPAILKTLSRMGNLTAKIAPAAGAAIGTAPNLAADPTTMPGGMPAGGTMGGTMNNGQPMQSSGNSYQDLVNAMQAQAVLAPSMGGGASSFLSQIAPQLQKNQLLESSLPGLMSSYANAGGAQGTGGILSRLSGLIPGTAAHTYQQQQVELAAQLGNAMGISPQAAMGLLPQLMQNGQTSGISQGILGNLSGQLAL